MDPALDRFRDTLPEGDADWNELQFLSWEQCRDMAPTILGLEITRLGRLIRSETRSVETRNALVRARFELEQFVRGLPAAEPGTIRETCLPHLQVAIVGLSMLPAALPEDAASACRYVLDRLNHIYRRLELLY